MSLTISVQEFLAEAKLPVFKRDICRAWGVSEESFSLALKVANTSWMRLVDDERVTRYESARQAGVSRVSDLAEITGFVTGYKRQTYGRWKRRMLDQGKIQAPVKRLQQSDTY